jgi:hypothetical protein
MAKRAAATYRSARREAWKALPRAERPTWAEYNQSPIGRKSGRGNGGGKPHPVVAELARHHLRMIGGFRVRYGNPTGKQYPAGAEGPVRRAARLAAAKPKRTRKVAS